MKKLLARLDKLFFWSLWPVALIIVYYGYLQARIEAQLQDNRYIETEIAKLNEAIKEVSELRKVRRSVIDRLVVVQDLTHSNSGQAAILKELAAIDSAISLKSLEFEPDLLLLKGKFTSQPAMVNFARQLEGFSFNHVYGRTYTYNLDYKIDNDRFTLEMNIDNKRN